MIPLKIHLPAHPTSNGNGLDVNVVATWAGTVLVAGFFLYELMELNTHLHSHPRLNHRGEFRRFDDFIVVRLQYPVIPIFNQCVTREAFAEPRNDNMEILGGCIQPRWNLLDANAPTCHKLQKTIGTGKLRPR